MAVWEDPLAGLKGETGTVECLPLGAIRGHPSQDLRVDSGRQLDAGWWYGILGRNPRREDKRANDDERDRSHIEPFHDLSFVRVDELLADIYRCAWDDFRLRSSLAACVPGRRDRHRALSVDCQH